VPIYEYECGLCHLHFDRRQRFDEEPVALCPKCQGEKTGGMPDKDKRKEK
jgi:putative FmdB family regulatory protein